MCAALGSVVVELLLVHVNLAVTKPETCLHCVVPPKPPLNMGDDPRDAGIEAARADIARVVTEASNDAIDSAAEAEQAA